MVRVSFREWYVTYQYNAYSERYTTTSNDLSGRYRLSPYFMNNLTAGWSIHLKRVDVNTELRVYNLFNESYHSILHRPMPGRNYSLVLMIKI
jgi:iron complex outermembrane receptor protein